MGDFGKILEQWEGGRSEPRSGQRSGPEQNNPDQMNAWLDQHPAEDKDADVPTADRAARRPNPEKLKIDDTLDLHGYRLQEALDVTGAFIERCVDDGYRKVLIIHGKGDNGQGVLRREIRTFLEQHPLTGTLGHGSGVEGGRGALWVILREKREPESAPDRHLSR